MSMTVVVTRNVAARVRGFLASCMNEIAPGIYTAPAMSRGVRDRMWKVCEDWFFELDDQSSIVLTWQDSSRASGQSIRVLGLPPREIVDHEGVFLTRVRPTEGADDSCS